MKPVKLKPCPFCGGRAKVGRLGAIGVVFYVHCCSFGKRKPDCPSRPTTSLFATKAAAIAAWNKRK
jgi:hypothetical protein